MLKTFIISLILFTNTVVHAGTTTNLTPDVPAYQEIIAEDSPVSCAALDLNACAEKVVQQSQFFRDLMMAHELTQPPRPIGSMTLTEWGEGGEIWSTHLLRVNISEENLEAVELFKVSLTVLDYDDEAGRKDASRAMIRPVTLQPKK